MKRKILFDIITAVVGCALTAFLWYLQEMPEQERATTWIDKTLNSHKYEFALAATLSVGVIIVLLTWIDAYKERNGVKKWLELLMAHMMQEHLGANNFHTRITIFKPVKGWRLFTKYVFYYSWVSLFDNFRLHRWRGYLHNIPWHFRSDYLMIYARKCIEKEPKSFTHFLMSRREEDFNGVADRCCREQMPISVYTNVTPSIRVRRGVAYDQRDMRYMENTHIGQSNSDTLLQVNSYATNFYAYPLLKPDQTLWGVVVIDNNEKEDQKLREQIEEYLSLYAKLFQNVISSM